MGMRTCRHQSLRRIRVILLILRQQAEAGKRMIQAYIRRMDGITCVIHEMLKKRAYRGICDRSEIEARCPRDRRITVDCTIDRHVVLTVPVLPSWLVKDLDARFERAFARTLIVRHR